MGWTKRDIVGEAYAELALHGYVYDLEPEELAFAQRRLDTFMAAQTARGVHIGYAMQADPTADDLDADSGLPLWAVEPVYLKLAQRIAAGKGKALPPSANRAAADAWSALLLKVSRDQMQEQQLAAGTPRGAGAKPWRKTYDPFLPRPDGSPLGIDASGGLDIIGD